MRLCNGLEGDKRIDEYVNCLKLDAQYHPYTKMTMLGSQHYFNSLRNVCWCRFWLCFPPSQVILQGVSTQ